MGEIKIGAEVRKTKRKLFALLIVLFALTAQLTLVLPVQAAPHTEINAAQAYAMIYSNSYPNLVIMDVRSPADYNAGHVPGAINLMVSRPSSSSPWNYENVTAWIATHPYSKNNEILVYCVSGTRAHATSNYLDTNGFTMVFDMGGYSSWSALVPADIDVKPETLNLGSNGRWITCYIELPTPNSVASIDVGTLKLNNVVSAESRPTGIGDYDDDGVPDLMIKFDRSAVQDLLVDEEIRLVVTFGIPGKLCVGWDIVKIIG